MDRMHIDLENQGSTAWHLASTQIVPTSKRLLQDSHLGLTHAEARRQSVERMCVRV